MTATQTPQEPLVIEPGSLAAKILSSALAHTGPDAFEFYQFEEADPSEADIIAYHKEYGVLEARLLELEQS